MVVHIYDKHNRFRKLKDVVKITRIYKSESFFDEAKPWYLFIEPQNIYKILVEDVSSIDIYESDAVYDLLSDHRIQKSQPLFK